MPRRGLLRLAPVYAGLRVHPLEFTSLSTILIPCTPLGCRLLPLLRERHVIG
jgi:hypothetical protein